MSVSGRGGMVDNESFSQYKVLSVTGREPGNERIGLFPQSRCISRGGNVGKPCIGFPSVIRLVTVAGIEGRIVSKLPLTSIDWRPGGKLAGRLVKWLLLQLKNNSVDGRVGKLVKLSRSHSKDTSPDGRVGGRVR